jgi:hypothetical protein
MEERHDPVGPHAARNTGSILRRLIWDDLVGGVGCLQSCCEVFAGLLIPVPAIAPQVNNAVRVDFAVSLSGVFRLSRGRPGFRFCVNGFTFSLAQLRRSLISCGLPLAPAFFRNRLVRSAPQLNEDESCKGLCLLPLSNRQRVTIVTEITGFAFPCGFATPARAVSSHR